MKYIKNVFLDFCPFCGSGDIRLYYDRLNETWNVECQECHGGLFDAEFLKDAINLWNGVEE